MSINISGMGVSPVAQERLTEMEGSRAAVAKAQGVMGRKYRSEAEIDKAATEFESVYLSQMLRHMMKEVKLPEPFGGGHAEEMYQSLMIDAYGDAIADAGGIGIKTQVKQELLKLQEV